MTINRPATFSLIKSYFGVLKQSQVDSFNLFFDEWDGKDKRHLAYILATVWHETNKTMLPIEEIGKGKGLRYGSRVWYDNKPYSDVPHIYYGRGYTQNTWRDIYLKLTKSNCMNWDFVNHPELLLQVKPSIWATFYAMEKGLYTGKKLGHYFNGEKSDPIWARSIINGKRKAEKLPDKAELICDYYNKFLNSIQ